MTQKHAIEKITSIRIVDDKPMTPERQIISRAFSLEWKLLQQHKKADQYAEEMKTKHGHESPEYQGMIRHRDALTMKLRPFYDLTIRGKASEELIAELYPIQRPNIFIMGVNGQERELPATLLAITFDQVIGYALQYGHDLEERLKSIEAMDAGPDRQTALVLWQVDKMYKAISFYAGIPLEALKSSGFDSEIAGIYQQTLQNIVDPQKK